MRVLALFFACVVGCGGAVESEPYEAPDAGVLVVDAAVPSACDARAFHFWGYDGAVGFVVDYDCVPSRIAANSSVDICCTASPSFTSEGER